MQFPKKCWRLRVAKAKTLASVAPLSTGTSLRLFSTTLAFRPCRRLWIQGVPGVDERPQPIPVTVLRFFDSFPGLSRRRS